MAPRMTDLESGAASSTSRANGRGSFKVRGGRERRSHHSHPVNVVHYDQATLGERVADKVAGVIGSWPFLITQTVIVSIWVVLNIIGFIRRWDPYPFILLNLLFSVQAAYAGPVILLASNRQTQKDRLTLEHADAEADTTGQRTLTILDEIRKNTEVTVHILERLQAGQEAPQTAEGVAEGTRSE
jgi:uncharacterized membrane protein